jgi:hypothetical protein
MCRSVMLLYNPRSGAAIEANVDRAHCLAYRYARLLRDQPKVIQQPTTIVRGKDIRCAPFILRKWI